MRTALWLAAIVACGGGAPRPETSASGGTSAGAALEARFPLARLDDRALCDHLLARTEADAAVFVDPEPRTRRKVIVSDLHLGPGTSDPRFAGIEDFYAEAEWAAMLERERAAGTVDLIIAGDFIELWQIATALGATPRLEDRVQPDAAGEPSQAIVLGTDQAFATRAVELVIAAHPEVFRALGRFLEGDNRVIVIAGNHDAHLLWPKVQLAIARAIAPRDPARLVFVPAAAYEHAGVHVAHGHAYDAANRFATNHAPFGRDRDGRCRLQTNWGEVFVDRFYTETERQVPFIDNLYPESAAILWALRDNPDAGRDLGAAVRFLDMLRSAQGKGLNRDAVGAVLQNVFGGSAAGDVLDYVSDRLTRGDPSAENLVAALMHLINDPELVALWGGLLDAARALPDLPAAFHALRRIDPDAVARLRDVLFGDTMANAAGRVIDERDVDVVVFGHTHLVGGTVQRLPGGGHYANTGSWIAVASVADLRARGLDWDRLSLADRETFRSRLTTVIVDHDEDGLPLAPIVQNAPGS